MGKKETKTIRLAVSLFSLIYGILLVVVDLYYPTQFLGVWLLPLGLCLVCLAFLFWPHKYHREKANPAILGAVVYFIYLTAILLLFYSLYTAGSTLNVIWGFTYTSPLIFLAALLYFVGRKITRKENLKLTARSLITGMIIGLLIIFLGIFTSYQALTGVYDRQNKEVKGVVVKMEDQAGQWWGVATRYFWQKEILRPAALPAEFQKENLPVKFKYQVMDVISPGEGGVVVDILDIAPR